MKIAQAREALTLNEYNRGASISAACKGAGYGPNITAGIAYRIGLADGRAAQREETAKAYKRAKALEEELKALKASEEFKFTLADLINHPQPDRTLEDVLNEPEQPTPGESEEDETHA